MEALRQAGVDARFAFVGGYKLERKIGDRPFVYPVIRKPQNPWAFLQSASAIRSLLRHETFDIVHAHLSYDHWLARYAIHDGVKLVRTFHNRRPLRGDVVTRGLIQRTDGIAVVNRTLLERKALRGREVAFTPPPVDTRFFGPNGADARSSYGLEKDLVVGVIGKITPGRGFEEAMQTFAAINRLRPDVRFLVIGRGFLRPELEEMTRQSGIEKSVTWAGYHEDDLPEHYRAMNLMVFTSTGSDQGHRAVSEAMACGAPVVSFPIAGVDEVIGDDLAPELIVGESSPDVLASRVVEILDHGDLARLRERCAAAMQEFDYENTAVRLIRLYQSVLGQP